MKRRVISLLLATAASVTCHAEAIDNKVVLATPEFNVTTRDFHYYVQVNLPQDRREATLGKKGVVRDIYENLYVIKVLSKQGESNEAIDMDEVEWLTKHYRERLLMNRHLSLEVERELAKVDWDAAAREEYQANQPQYTTDERVSAAHVLIGLDDRSEEEALARAQEVLAKLKAGEDFAAVATEYSDDPSVAVNKGELGFFGRKQMVLPFEEAAFAMTEKGQLSEPVKTQFGYHIIRFNERKEPQLQPFDAVKERIIASLKKKTAGDIRAEKINAIKSGAVDFGLKVDVPLLEQLEKQYLREEESASDKAAIE